MAKMTSTEFVRKLKDIAQNYKTLYVKGCFGAPLTAANKPDYYGKNSDSRIAKIKAATADTFGFDCVCLVKGVLWGWCGDKNDYRGGAKFASNGVPDIGTEEIIGVCASVSTDFNKIEVGELCWMPGHVGVYIGDGLAVECTSSWSDNVQITACNCTKAGYNRRDWSKHGKLPYVDYTTTTTTTTQEEKKVNITATVLKQGSQGEAVKALQALLNLRVGAGMYIDGVFGPKTDAALRKYQESRGLTVDGSCGAATWTAILSK